MTQFHFISGLPRSGSTLLAAILRQNPAVHASMSSPVGGYFSSLQKAMSGSNEASIFSSNEKRARHLRALFDVEYGFAPDEIVFDTNRVWPSKLPVLTRLFPDAKFIACVRRPAWVVDSIERLVRANPFDLSGIFGFESGGTVFSRAHGLMSTNGLVGFAIDALREGYYSPLASGRLMLVEYEALAKNPKATVDGLYAWLGLPRFEHDFANVEQIPGAAQFDQNLKTPGLHYVWPKVEWRERASVLPPDLFKSLPAPFWRASPNPAIQVIHVNEDARAASAAPAPVLKPPDQIEAMKAEAQRMLAVYNPIEKENADG